MYQATFDGTHYELGTSGFLYRSNKLMYDRETKSLWSSILGKPVVGPLVGKGIQLERGHVVTSTWGEWKRRHPDSKVLSLNTNYERDYSEGMAYRNYFSNDRLMFAIPNIDTRLKNKDSVLALRESDEQLAISASFLLQHPVYHDKIGGKDFVVLTDPTGANRVYDSTGVTFTSWDGDAVVDDDAGNNWKLSEEALTNRQGQSLERLPAHRAFWFGWQAQFPNTRLVRQSEN